MKQRALLLMPSPAQQEPGAGLNLAACTALSTENFHAYGVATHRHTPEIEQIYSEFAGEDVVIQFTPHLLPVDRGIFGNLLRYAETGRYGCRN